MFEKAIIMALVTAILILLFLRALITIFAIIKLKKINKDSNGNGVNYLQCHVKCESCGSEYDLIGRATGSNQCPKCGKHIVLMGERK